MADSAACGQGPDHIDGGPRSQARSQDPDPQTGRVQGPCRCRTRNRAGHRRGPNSCQHPRRRQHRGSRCRPTPRSRNRCRLGVRVRCGSRNVRRSWSHPGGETNRRQTPHRRRVPPRRLLYRHRSPHGDLSRQPHRPPTSRRYRPLREAVQRLPPPGTMHHLAERGRTITVDKHHDRRAANKPRWAKEETQNTYRNLRPSAERTIAWLTRHNPRRVPYRGIIPNQQWPTTPTAAINLQRLINLGLTHTTTGWATNPA